MFKNMDSDNSGTITLEELKQGLAKQGTKLSENEVKQLMEAVCSICIKILLINSISLSRRKEPSFCTNTSDNTILNAG